MHCSENVKCTTTMRNSMEVLQKLKTKQPYYSAIPLLGIHLRELEAGSQREVCTHVFVTTLSTAAKRWQPPRCPLTDKWINRMWCLYGMKYSTLKRKGILSHITWMNLEDIRLSKRSQSHKNPLYDPT